MFDNNTLFLQIFGLARQNAMLDGIFIFGARELIFIMYFLVFVLILLGGPKERKAFLILILGLIISESFIQITHLFFNEPRPYVTFNLIPLIHHIPNPSFPSGHATLSAIVAFAYLFTKSKYSLLFVLTAIWVGFSRIFVGVHYPLDVVGGIFYALFSIFLASKLLNKFLED